jgi:diguanylate cyclase (GGDEF)-like protein/PAS domain S-box-containing protein
MEKSQPDSDSSQLSFQETIEQLQQTLAATHQGWFDLNLDTGRAVVNEQYAMMLGYDPKTFVETLESWHKRLRTEDRSRVEAVFRDYAEGRRPDYRVEFLEQTHCGEWIWILSVGAIVARNPLGKPLRLVGTRIDITERKRAEAAKVISEARYGLLLENSMDAIIQASADGQLTSVNPAACTLFRATETEMLQLHSSDILDHTDARLEPMLAERSLTGRARGEVRMVRADGTHFEAEATTVLYQGHDGAMVTSMHLRDITDRHRYQAEIERLAYFDSLTGLPNRASLMRKLNDCHVTKNIGDKVDALFLLDLDQFKLINDTRGHAVGDAFLSAVASRIRDAVGTHDLVARFGGDEFVIHAPDIANETIHGIPTAIAIGQSVCYAVQQPIEIAGQVHVTTCSVGVTLFPKGEQQVNDLLREADTAMYHAKACGRNRVVMFEPKMHAELESRLQLERDLTAAIDRNELALYCQAQVDCRGNVVGSEMLLRWRHATQGYVPPDIFIPLAEESDLIFHIGTWVIEAACSIEVQMRRQDMSLPLSINISPKQFRHPDFVTHVKKTIAITKAHASQLIFEVTEGLLIEDVEEIVTRMNELKNIGVRFSIDDFGTGYSSLAYLKRLPLYELKIDKQFAQDVPTDADDVAIVHSIISMAKHLRLRVVAEGVETQEQADFLCAVGCDSLQGYLYARPVPIAEFLRWL